MMLKAPKFWYNADDKLKWLGDALSPLGDLYALLVEKRLEMNAAIPLQKPVICIGNATLGGHGKTPLALALADILKELEYNPHFLSRGYGGSEAGPLQVSLGRDTAEFVGDEALLLAEKSPAWVSKNRALGAQFAFDSGADIVIMDDGLQNPYIYKNLSFLVIDGKLGFGNKKIFPAGPLREKIERAVLRCDAVVIIGDDEKNIAAEISTIKNMPIFFAAIESARNNPYIRGKKIAAFAGIGHPLKFKTTLEDAGAEVALWREFPDHHPYTEQDLKGFIEAAEQADEEIFTTAKDFVRIPQALRKNIKVFAIELALKNKYDLKNLIKEKLGR